MKINFVTPFFYPVIGGAEIYAYELCKRLAKRGYKITVHTAIYDLNNKIYNARETLEGFEVIRYKPIFRKFYYYWFWLPKIKNTDILHVCGYGHMCFSLAVQKYYKRFPLVTTTCGVSALIEGPKSRWLRKRYDEFIGVHHLKLVKKIIVWANEEKEWCVKRGIPESLIKKIPIGIPEESYYVYDCGNFRNKHYINERYIIYLGRIHIQKGLDTLIKAFSLIANKYRDIKLILVGPDNGFLNNIFLLAKMYKIERKILWIPSMVGRKKYEIISGCEFLVLPSKYELQGIVLVEAMAQGKPVIATNVGGIPDFVKDKENGFLFEVGDVENLAKKMEYLLSDKEVYNKLSFNAKKTAEKFRWDRIIDEYEETYKEILTQKSKL